MNKDIVVIYHSMCNDGFGAAWSAWKKFGNEAEYIPAQHGSSPPELISKLIYLIDFTYPRIEMEKLYGEHDVYIIDHHKSAQEQLSDLPNTLFDMNKSGALLAWEYFHPDIDTPWFIQYVSDADLWKWELPQSELINALLKSLPFNFEVWNELLNVNIEDPNIMHAALVALSGQNREIDYIIATNTIMNTQINKIPTNIINYQGTLSSKIAEKLYYNGNMAVCWFINGKDAYYSLRSKIDTDIDVSKIASKFGGGGHFHASGFRIPLNKIPKEWKFWK